MFLERNEFMVPIFSTFISYGDRDILILSLFKELQLTDSTASDALRSDFVLPVERVNRIEHLFSYENLHLLISLIDEIVQSVSQPMLHFYEFLSYLLIRRNTTADGKWIFFYNISLF